MGEVIKKAGFLLAIFIFTSAVHAQIDTAKYQTALNKFKTWYNSNQPDSLYTLFPESRRRTLNSEKWKQILESKFKFLSDSIKYFAYSHFKDGMEFFKGIIPNPRLYFEISFDEKLSLISMLVQENQALKTKTPKPYNSEDIEFDNPDKSVHFGGTFTYPKMGSSFPTVLLITGSGQQDRDETAFGHKPFAVLADYLTRNGYAVLRWDDRGIGKTTGLNPDVTTTDFAKDISNALDYIKTRKEVDKSKLGLIGHSEGGMIAYMVAAARIDIDFIVLWGAPIVNMKTILVEQYIFFLRKYGIKEDAIKAFKELHLAEYSSFKNSNDSTEIYRNFKLIFNNWKKRQPSGILDVLINNENEIVYPDLVSGKNIFCNFLEFYKSVYNSPSYRFFICYDPIPDLAKVKCKVLAINGDKDTQVDANSNISLLNEILKMNNHPNFKTVILKNLNHLLQTAVTGDISEYASIPETIAPLALNTILNWMNEQVKNK